MKQTLTIRDIVLTAMMAALTLLGTYVFRIPTPALGYIHVGDAFVLLSGIVLGPALGALAAGIGSGLADLFSGYAIWAPGTLIVKALAAMTAAILYKKFKNSSRNHPAAAVVLSGIFAELIVIAGYFIYHSFVIGLITGGFTKAALLSALSMSAAEIPFNLVQGIAGIALGCVLAPVFTKIGTTTRPIPRASGK